MRIPTFLLTLLLVADAAAFAQRSPTPPPAPAAPGRVGAETAPLTYAEAAVGYSAPTPAAAGYGSRAYNIAATATRASYTVGGWSDESRREMPHVPEPKLPSSKSTQPADAADSLYRLGRSALTDGDFRRAAEVFATLASRYPDSEFASDALYYRAYALYKIGNSRELQLAVDALDRQATRYPKAGTLNDAKQLRASIRSEQAKRGDGAAAADIQQGANVLRTESRCPTADDDMRLTALNGLQGDPDLLIPTLQKLLARTDECSIRLRQRAVYMIAQTREEERADILLRTASTDPSIEVRREAVQWLSEVNTERAARALDSILFSAKDAEIRDRALSALSRHRNPAARQSLKRFAEQANVSTELRARAINYIGSGRKTGDEAEYLQGLFNKTASPELRQAIIEAFSNLKTPDRVQWLLNVARDRKQELEVRKRALFSASQNGVELKELFAMYDEMKNQPDMQDQLIYVYAQRKEPEATDRLIEIAKTEKDVSLKKKALFWLGSKKDPKVKQFLLEFIAQP